MKINNELTMTYTMKNKNIRPLDWKRKLKYLYMNNNTRREFLVDGDKYEQLEAFIEKVEQQAVAYERARVRGEIEQKVEEYKQKACVAANSLEYDEVNMLRYIERQEVRWVVNRLIDAKRDFSDLLSSLDKLVTERTNL